MKIAFISDIHLNLSNNTLWEIDRYTKLFNTLRTVSNSVDLLILGGDIFDNPNPTLPELKVFYEQLSGFDKEPYVLGGNHEVIGKARDTFSYIPHVGFKYIGFDVIRTKKTNIYLCSNKDLKEMLGIRKDLSAKQNLLFTHVRCDIPPHIKEEFDCTFLSKNMDLVISGDIHYKFSPFDNFHYCGQPYSNKYKPEVANGYFIVDTDTLDVEYVEIFLPNKVKYDVSTDVLTKLKSTLKDCNLYKLKVIGTIDTLQELPKSSGNITYEKQVLTTETKVVESITDGKINIVQTLLGLVKDTYTLNDEIMEMGASLINGISQKYKNS